MGTIIRDFRTGVSLDTLGRVVFNQTGARTMRVVPLVAADRTLLDMRYQASGFVVNLAKIEDDFFYRGDLYALNHLRKDIRHMVVYNMNPRRIQLVAAGLAPIMPYQRLFGSMLELRTAYSDAAAAKDVFQNLYTGRHNVPAISEIPADHPSRTSVGGGGGSEP